MDCELCGVVQNEKYRVVFEDEHVAIILNFEPIKEGHLFIQPQRHVEHMSDLKGSEAESFLQAIQRSMEIIEKVFKDNSVCIVNGWYFRSQPHLHAHVLPSKFGVRGLFEKAEGTPHRTRVAEDLLKKAAEELRPFFN